AVNPPRAPNVNLLYNVALLVQNYPAFAFQGSGIEARFLPLDTRVAFLDIRFVATETNGGLLLECECNADLFDRTTADLLLAGYRDVLEQMVSRPNEEVGRIRIPEALARQARAGGATPLPIAVAATFTCEPVQQPLNFWMKRLGIPARIQFAPYNQVFQQLLDSSSLLSRNQQGVNVVVLRIEDLLPAGSISPAEAPAQLTTSAEDFLRSFRAAVQRTAACYLVCICPPSAEVRGHAELAEACGQAESLLIAGLNELPGISVVASTELLRLYPVSAIEDEYAWRVGHIPYTQAFFTALATMMARRIRLARNAPHQVIVVDCDQILWKGSCREAGPAGVEVDAPRRALQEFLITRQEAGMILCLCGKEPEALAGVFDQNPAMLLGWEHIAETRFDPRSTSEKLHELARDLGLDLGSFVFVSSNLSECAAVRAHCPAVTVAQLPSNAEQIPNFLLHFWAFDCAPGVGARDASPPSQPDQFAEIAARLSTVEAIVHAIESEVVLPRAARTAYVAPRTAVEELLADIWARLLRVEKPGIRDNFFALGGHSLLAVQVIARVRQILGLEMPLRAMFESPTIAEFAARLEAVRGQSAAEAALLRPVPRQGAMPLSYTQQRLWFLDQLEPGTPLYNISAMYRMWGPLNIEALQRTFNEIVRRHESLRATFRNVDGQPIQVISPELQLPIRIVHHPGLSGEDREREIERFAQEEAARPFDLSAGPLLRVSLLELGDDEHALVVVLHHIVGDGWSGSLLAGEMAALYQAFTEDRPSPLPELPIQYADFAVWQRQWMQGGPFDAQLAYWKRQLTGAPSVLELPTDRPRPAVQRHRGAVRAQLIPRELLERVRNFSQGEGVTLFMTLLSVFKLLLSRYSGQEDVVVGSTIAGRNYSEVEPLIGFFVNTLALRTDLSGDPTFRDLLARVKQVALDGYAHQEVPFEKLVEELQPERSLSHNPIFQVLFGLQNVPRTTFEASGLKVQRTPVHPATSLFDMSWFAFETPEGLLLRVEYDTDLFEEETIARAVGHFGQLLEAAIASPENRLSQLPLLT
ncbi:MAG TPA: condensation domain-containing protein, partial [Terriglobales bacterium]|nr:condensation domain-containing protein [Terriglobales bacterium]